MPQFFKLMLYNEINLSVRFQDYLVTFGNILTLFCFEKFDFSHHSHAKPTKKAASPAKKDKQQLSLQFRITSF